MPLMAEEIRMAKVMVYPSCDVSVVEAISVLF